MSRRDKEIQVKGDKARFARSRSLRDLRPAGQRGANAQDRDCEPENGLCRARRPVSPCTRRSEHRRALRANTGLVRHGWAGVVRALSLAFGDFYLSNHHPHPTMALLRLYGGPMRPVAIFSDLERFLSCFRVAHGAPIFGGSDPPYPPEPLCNSCFRKITGARRFPLRLGFLGSGLQLRRNPTP